MQAYNTGLKAFKETPDFDALMEKVGLRRPAAKSTTSAEPLQNEG